MTSQFICSEAIFETEPGKGDPVKSMSMNLIRTAHNSRMCRRNLSACLFRFLESRTQFSLLRLHAQPAGRICVAVRERGWWMEASQMHLQCNRSGCDQVTPQEYIKIYYTDGIRNIGEIVD